MGVRILHDAKAEMACLYDSVSDEAFGPVFGGADAEDQVNSFLEFLDQDARTFSRSLLMRNYAAWHRASIDEETGELIFAES
jgi:hypothetical protein